MKKEQNGRGRGSGGGGRGLRGMWQDIPQWAKYFILGLVVFALVMTVADCVGNSLLATACSVS